MNPLHIYIYIYIGKMILHIVYLYGEQAEMQLTDQLQNAWGNRDANVRQAIRAILYS